MRARYARYPDSAAFTAALALPKSIRPVYFALERSHDLAHVLDRRRAGLGDRGLHRLGDLGLGKLLGQIGGNHRDLAALLASEVFAPGFFVDFKRFLTAFDHFLQQRQQIVVGEGLARAARLDVLVLQRGVDQPQRVDLGALARLHRRLEVFRNLLAHRVSISGSDGLHPPPTPPRHARACRGHPRRAAARGWPGQARP